MEQVLQCYGKGIAAGIVLIAVMVLLFAGIRDEQGNRGIINIVKTWIPEGETITENAAIGRFCGGGGGSVSHDPVYVQWYAAQGSISAGRLIFCGRRNGRRTKCFVV